MSRDGCACGVDMFEIDVDCYVEEVVCGEDLGDVVEDERGGGEVMERIGVETLELKEKENESEGQTLGQ